MKSTVNVKNDQDISKDISTLFVLIKQNKNRSTCYSKYKLKAQETVHNITDD